MKKKNLDLKLNLKKQTVTDLNAVTGGRPVDPTLLTNDCQRTVVQCETQGTAWPCCPGCRSGYNATMVKDLCGVVLETVDQLNCAAPYDPAGPVNL